MLLSLEMAPDLQSALSLGLALRIWFPLTQKGANPSCGYSSDGRVLAYNTPHPGFDSQHQINPVW